MVSDARSRDPRTHGALPVPGLHMDRQVGRYRNQCERRMLGSDRHFRNLLGARGVGNGRLAELTPSCTHAWVPTQTPPKGQMGPHMFEC